MVENWIKKLHISMLVLSMVVNASAQVLALDYLTDTLIATNDKVVAVDSVSSSDLSFVSTFVSSFVSTSDLSFVSPSGYGQETKNLTFTVNGVTFTMVAVQGGTFTMGATSEQENDSDSDEKLTHSVTLSDYYIGQTEVTQGLWKAVMGTTIGQQKEKSETHKSLYGEGKDYPMYYVNWEECQEFISRLNSVLSSQLGDKHFTMSTEAQWEYAARGGNKSQGYKCSGRNAIAVVGWYWDNSDGVTHPVGKKQANELGIYDMSGNVWEWCEDWYGDYSSDSQTNPTGPSSGSHRVGRGGSWYSDPEECRVSYRFMFTPSYRYYDMGFRLVLNP